jgi:urease accessory protein
LSAALVEVATRCPEPAVVPPVVSGRGALAVARVAGATSLVRARAAAPLKLLVPRPRGPAVWAYAATLGGGLVAGDAIDLEIDVGPGATALVATQASTKVYRGDGRRAEQRLRARVGDGALLALLPDPVCCFAGASYRQAQEIDLARGGSLLLSDVLAAGRVARGERWAFTSYASCTTISIDGRLEMRDALRLADERGGEWPSLAARMGRIEALATIVLTGPRLALLAARLLDDLAARPAAAAPLLAGGSPVTGGAIVRVAGERIADVIAFIRQAFAGIGADLGEEPFARRH